MPTDYRLLVWNGQREKTLGGLKKSDLVKNSKGRIVSKRKSEVAKKLNNLGLGKSKPKAKPRAKAAAINPLTMQPKKQGLSEVSIDNILLGKRKKKKPKPKPPKAKSKLSIGQRLKLLKKLSKQ